MGELPLPWAEPPAACIGANVASVTCEVSADCAPALLVAGGPGSHVDQGQLAEMAALIPDCELVTIPAGHLVHDARPAEFSAVVISFLRRPGDAFRSVAT